MLTSIQDFYQRHPRGFTAASLFFAALFLRLLGIAQPDSAVFDEVHFNYFAAYYYSGQYYYDIHPPLGKLLIALAALPFGGLDPESAIRTIGTPYPSETYLAMRALPILFGSALPALLYLVARELRINQAAAITIGMLSLFDNAFFVQSRFILLDAMLLGFGFLAIWTFLAARRSQSLGLLLCSAVFAGASASVKWIGIGFLGLIGLVMIYDWVHALIARNKGVKAFGEGLGYLILAITTYTLTFAIHFALLPISHQQGDQFMSYSFRAGLEGSEYQGVERTVTSWSCPSNYQHKLRYGLPEPEIKPVVKIACSIKFDEIDNLGFLDKFFELNTVMYRTNQGLSQSHPDGSPWYSWPFMTKPLYYWHQNGARIYFLGNPITWLGTVLGVAFIFFGQFFRPAWRQNEAFWVLMTGFWANLLPFMLVSRVMFMYHYLTSLCFAILLAGYALSKLPINQRHYLILNSAIFALFVFLSPISFGLNWYGSDLLWFLRLFGWHP